MYQSEINRKAVEFAKTKLKDCFILGKNWNGVPISHDMLKKTTWIYNTEIEGSHNLEDFSLTFIKFDHIPDETVSDTLEWRTIDCLSFAKKYSCRDWGDTIRSLLTAVTNKKLDIDLLINHAQDYGDQLILKEILNIKKKLDRRINRMKSV